MFAVFFLCVLLCVVVSFFFYYTFVIIPRDRKKLERELLMEAREALEEAERRRDHVGWDDQQEYGE